MNKILCDKCQEQIKPLIESKHLTGGIVINYFRCNSCKVKYLIDVTDGITRDKQIRYSYMVKKIEVKLKQVTKDNLEAMESEIFEEQSRAEQLLKEIKEAKAELKAKYEGEL